MIPVGPGSAVVGLVDLPEVNQACRLLLEVSEHVRQNFPENILKNIYIKKHNSKSSF